MLTRRALVTAAVVLVLAVTPTIIDTYTAWPDPGSHVWIIGSYTVAVLVALSAWRMFA